MWLKSMQLAIKLLARLLNRTLSLRRARSILWNRFKTVGLSAYKLIAYSFFLTRLPLISGSPQPVKSRKWKRKRRKKRPKGREVKNTLPPVVTGPVNIDSEERNVGGRAELNKAQLPPRHYPATSVLMSTTLSSTFVPFLAQMMYLGADELHLTANEQYVSESPWIYLFMDFLEAKQTQWVVLFRPLTGVPFPVYLDRWVDKKEYDPVNLQDYTFFLCQTMLRVGIFPTQNIDDSRLNVITFLQFYIIFSDNVDQCREHMFGIDVMDRRFKAMTTLRRYNVLRELQEWKLFPYIWKQLLIHFPDTLLSIIIGY